jgi:hypothetical protein
MLQRLFLSFLMVISIFACTPKVNISQKKSLLATFTTQTGIKAIEAKDDSLLLKAKRWQGSGNYPGVDAWEILKFLLIQCFMVVCLDNLNFIVLNNL